MEIEELADERPEALARVPVDAIDGRRRRQGARDRRRGRLPGRGRRRRSPTLVQKLWDVFVDEDATLVEVNPLVKTADGRIVALDGKVTLDDNADFRQPDHAALEDKAAADPLEAKAKEKDLNYVKLDGEVGIIGNGAGLVMSTLDVVAYAGEESRRREAGQLPRHRRRRLGRGDGQRPGDHPLRPGGASRCSSTSSAASPPATRSPTASCRRSRCSSDRGEEVTSRWSSASTATTPRRAGGSSTEAEPAAGRAGRHDGRRRRARRRAGCGREVRGHRHGDLADRELARSSSRA